MNWRLEDGRKVPCRADGRKCDPTDPANFTDYATAEAAPYDVAFVVKQTDPWFFLDLDKCLVDGDWTQDAKDIVSYFPGCWIEVSQSGTGLHIMGKCDKALLHDRKNKWNGWLEFYINDRFIAFGKQGWQPIGGIPTDKLWTNELRAFVPERPLLGDLPEGRETTYTGPEDDQELIQMMLRTQNVASQFGEGVTVKDLWEANVAKLSVKYPAYDDKDPFDRSSADAGLMSHLAFWTGKDMPRMERLFRQSALMRDKFDKRQDYRRDTIHNAVRLCNKWYDKPRPEPEQTHFESYLTINEMIEHFKGCTYIIESHRVLMPNGDILKPEAFKATMGGHRFQMEPASSKTSTNAFEAFTENRCHRFPKASGTCFYPDRPFGELIDGNVNCYVKPNVKTRQGDLGWWWSFLERLIPEERERRIVMSYCRFVVQNPGKKALWTIGLVGTEGNGKSLIWDLVRYAVGTKYAHKVRAEQLGTQFNGWMTYKIFLQSDEVFFPGKREVLESLKPAITDYTMPVRNMYSTESNFHCPTNWGFTSNYDDAFLKTRSDRRYCVIRTAQYTLEDVHRDFPKEFLQNFFDWLDNQGGREMIAWDMHNTPPDPEFDPNNGCVHAPDTSFTEKLMDLSQGAVEQEIVEAVETERVGFRGGYISTFALEQLLDHCRVKVSRGKRGQILEQLGYRHVGRASVLIMRESGTRPQIYYKGDDTEPTTQKYIQAQGPDYQ